MLPINSWNLNMKRASVILPLPFASSRLWADGYHAQRVFIEGNCGMWVFNKVLFTVKLLKILINKFPSKSKYTILHAVSLCGQHLVNVPYSFVGIVKMTVDHIIMDNALQTLNDVKEFENQSCMVELFHLYFWKLF